MTQQALLLTSLGIGALAAAGAYWLLSRVYATQDIAGRSERAFVELMGAVISALIVVPIALVILLAIKQGF